MGWQAPHSPPGNFLTLVAKGSELNNFRALGIAAGMTSKAQSAVAGTRRPDLFPRADGIPCREFFARCESCVETGWAA